MKCSELKNTESLYKTEVTLLEIESNMSFKAFVVDYGNSSEKQGIIVRLTKEDSKKLSNQNIILPSYDDKYDDTYVELDLTSMYHGHLFNLISLLH
jgi:hypothetical protein